MPSSRKFRVLVMGGGFAGLAAACALADDFEVTLLEKRPHLGGRVYSMRDPKTGAEMDNGQHVFLGGFDRLRAFFSRIGISQQVHLQKKLSLRLFYSDRNFKRRSVALEAASLPSPLHLAPALLKMNMLSWGERLSLARAMEKIRKMSDADMAAWKGKNFGDWLAAQNQEKRAVDFFWNLFALSALNVHASECDAATAFFVFRRGLLESAESSGIGFFACGQGVAGEAAKRYVEERGGRIILDLPVREIRAERNRVTGVEDSSGHVHAADAYVSAMTPDALYAAVTPSLKNLKPFSNLLKIEGSSLAGVHLWYDRQIVDFDFAGFPGHPLQWVFNKTRVFGASEGAGQYLSVVLSAAREWMPMPKDDIVKKVNGYIREWFPEAAEVKLVHARVVKEPFATLLPSPGFDRLRPAPRTGLPNLILAGEWTATGWPSTMEGAVRSGEAAAAAVRELLS